VATPEDVAVQDVTHALVATEDGDLRYPAVAGAPSVNWPAEFSQIAHLRENESPCMTVAFPRGAFYDLGLPYDESLTAVEDWHYLVRAAAVAGVVGTAELTSVYRLWADTQGSRHVHDENEWEVARRAVLRDFDDLVAVLPRAARR
jgi:hypothetical protein